MYLEAPTGKVVGTVDLPVSKSESNRLLIINALMGGELNKEIVSSAQDSQTLYHILQEFRKVADKKTTFDVGAAGTCMRFLTAFFAIQDKEVILTGSSRMKERPIGTLVNALNQLGADINYLEREGYPPLLIKGRPLKGGKVTLKANISSQYISALLMVAPYFLEGLQLQLEGDITSKPYVDMTISMMAACGVEVLVQEKQLSIPHANYKNITVIPEADWSAASYWYEIAALSDNCDLKLKGLKEFSLQGDAIAIAYFEKLGVKTHFEVGGIRLTKFVIDSKQELFFNLNDCPDLAQTLVATCAGLGLKAKFTGLHTLRIKETDRILALKYELRKLSVQMQTTDDSIELLKRNTLEQDSFTEIKTYDDHRMAMCMAPLALKVDQLKIKEPEVVAKSYPNFWDDLEEVGFKMIN